MSLIPFTKAPGAGHGLVARVWSPLGLTVASLCGITLAFYHGLWLPGLVLIKRDAFVLHVPLKLYLMERLVAGELPQWFPYDGLGRPFIGVPHTGIFHPFTVLYFLLPIHDAYRASTLLSCLLSALGAFVLGRTLNLSRTGALIAGIAFAISGFVVSVTDSLLYLYSICALPVFCLALEKALIGSRAWMVAPAAVWASVFLIGDVQTGYYYGFIALLWTAMRAPGSRLEAGLRLGLVGGLAVLLAGIQLGPAWAVFVDSDRMQPALFHDQALYWSTHPLRLVTVVAAPVAEHASPMHVGRFFFGQPGGLWAESLYLGLPVLGLALLGARHRRDLRVFVLLGGVALWLALGTYGGIYELFYRIIPLWAAFRYPEKLMGVVSFAAAMLAGAGLDSLRTGKGCPAAWLAATAVCAGVGLGLRAEPAAVWAAAWFNAPQALTQAVTDSAGLAFFYSAIAALGMWLIVIGARNARLGSPFALLALIALTVLDLSRANLGAYHTAPAKVATFIPPLAEAVRAREGTLSPGRFRIVTVVTLRHLTAMLDASLARGGDTWAVESVLHRHMLSPEHNAQFHIESANRYLPGSSSTFAAMSQHKLGMRVAARYNATYYVSGRLAFKDPQLAETIVAELRGLQLALFKNPFPVKPRVYLSRKPERAASPVDPAVLLARPDFPNGDVDVIETTDAALPGPELSGSAVIERYTPEEVRVRVETPQPAALILLDAFDQGWRATLENGLELPIMRANALVRAVAVPAGTHLVTFSYQTPLLKAGAAASLVGCLLCLGLITHARWRHRHPAGPRQ